MEGKMEFDPADSSSTLKLSFYNSFPSKKREPPGMATLPTQTLASIPFHWEEAPGKPRAPLLLKSSKTSSVRCLVPPPPRLTSTNDSSSTKFTNMSSPTTVLGGPHSGCSMPHEERLRGHRRRRDGKERLNSTSWRWSWGSYKEINRISGGAEDSNDFSLAAGVGVGVGNESDHTKVNIATTRVVRRRRRSNCFLSLSTTTSSLLSSIYENFKQAVVPWKSRSTRQMRNMD